MTGRIYLANSRRSLATLVIITAFLGLLMAGKAMAQSNESRPKVVVLATGGTIAGGAADGDVEYQAGAFSVEQLISAVPSLADLARISGKQISNIGSQDMNAKIWGDLAREIAELRKNAPDTAVVITHGTDTMEETGYFLDLLFPTGAPIVLTGAMRPGDHPNTDGPENLEQAVRVAADPRARDHGALIVMHGEIHAARDVAKIHTEALDAFGSGRAGLVGLFHKDGLTYLQQPRPSDWPTTTMDVSTLNFPKVGIIYAHADMDSGLVGHFSGQDYRGIVLAGFGNGNTNAATLGALQNFVNPGVVVRSSKVGGGFVSRNVEVDDDANRFVTARDLSPQKARILLQLLLNRTNDPAVIQAAFDCEVPLSPEHCNRTRRF